MLKLFEFAGCWAGLAMVGVVLFCVAVHNDDDAQYKSIAPWLHDPNGE
jgi:hypothetical protein